jgi:DNA topoisomerase-1
MSACACFHRSLAGEDAVPMPRLRRVDCSVPGIRRVRRGRGFSYLDERGRRIADRETLERIRALVIPPAWEDVWICPHPNGHIQALGTDARGRRQYRYHDEWRRRRDREKFDRMVDFARRLPTLRRRTARQVRGREPTRERVLAGAIRLLDRGFFRIGGEEYTEDNGTYGLATLRRRHVRLEPRNQLVFEYPAKGGKRVLQSVVDSDVHRLVAQLKRRRAGGDELLAYKNGRRWHDVRSSDINEHVKELTRGDFTAKDFRTWGATVLAAVSVAEAAAGSRAARKRAVTRAVEEVSTYLGNTPAVCRASYIDPRVFDRYDAGLTIADTLETLSGADLADPIGQTRIERAVLDLIADEEPPSD